MKEFHRYIRNFQRARASFAPRLRVQLFLLAIAFVMGGLTSYAKLIDAQASYDKLLVELEQINQNTNKLQADFAEREMNISLLKQVNSNLSTDLLKLQKDEVQLRSELNFYRSIMAPEKAAEGVYLNDVEFIHNPVKGNSYRVKLALTQLKSRKSYTKGSLSVYLVGTLNGKTEKLSFTKLGVKADELSFAFTYFQLIDVVIDLPNGFKPHTIKADVNVSKSRWRKAAHTEAEFNFVDKVSSSSERILDQNSQHKDNSTELDEGQ